MSLSSFSRTPECLCVYSTPIRCDIHIQTQNKIHCAHPDDAPASQHWKVIKAALSLSLSLSLSLISRLKQKAQRWTCAPHNQWCPVCYISTPVKTSLWRTFPLTGLIFRLQHLLPSTPPLGLLSPLLKNITLNTSSISPCSLPLLWAGPMWDKTFIHLLWVPWSEKASPSSLSSKSAQLMKITLSGGWTASLWTHNGNKERARDRGGAILRETKETRVCALECVRIVKSFAQFVGFGTNCDN